MHELIMNFLYLLATCLSVMGGMAVILILIGMVKGIVNMVEDAMKAHNHDEEDE